MTPLPSIVADSPLMLAPAVARRLIQERARSRSSADGSDPSRRRQDASFQFSPHTATDVRSSRSSLNIAEVVFFVLVIAFSSVSNLACLLR